MILLVFMLGICGVSNLTCSNIIQFAIGFIKSILLPLRDILSIDNILQFYLNYSNSIAIKFQFSNSNRVNKENIERINVWQLNGLNKVHFEHSILFVQYQLKFRLQGLRLP